MGIGLDPYFHKPLLSCYYKHIMSYNYKLIVSCQYNHILLNNCEINEYTDFRRFE